MCERERDATRMKGEMRVDDASVEDLMAVFADWC